MYKPKPAQKRSDSRRPDSRKKFDSKKPGQGGSSYGREQGPRERRRPSAKFQLSKGTVIDYKDIALLQKYVSDRGKILSRRVTGISAKEQRAISHAIRRSRFLGLLPILGSKLR